MSAPRADSPAAAAADVIGAHSSETGWGLHVVPDSMFEPRHRFLGSTKDVRGRTEYFRARDIPIVEIAPEARSDTDLLRRLRELDLRDCRFALLEYTYYPESLRWLRRARPHILRLTRPHNAEFLHRLHRVLAAIKLRRFDRAANVARQVVRIARDARRALALDVGSVRASDGVLAITDWEARTYWSALAPGKVHTVPYFLPAEYQTERPGDEGKRLQCICYLSPTLNSFLLDAARNFLRTVTDLGWRRPDWSFAITGELAAPLGPTPPRVRILGCLDNPLPVLAESRAIAILSDYGFGFKTKLLDAIEQRCVALVTPRVYGRLPLSVRPYCIRVDPRSTVSFEQALERCEAPFPDGDPNEMLRKQAYDSLDRLLLPLFRAQGIGARKSGSQAK